MIPQYVVILERKYPWFENLVFVSLNSTSVNGNLLMLKCFGYKKSSKKLKFK